MVVVADECRIERESGVTNIWYPKGKYPDIKVEQKKEAVSFYGALNVKTGKENTLILPKQNSHYTVEFLEQLEEEYQGKDALLIWDGAPSHRGEVKKYLRRRNKKWRIKLMYLPPYSPDYSPQEQVWKQGKQNVTHNSEDDFFTKVVKFYEFLKTKRFKTNFMKKWSRRK